MTKTNIDRFPPGERNIILDEMVAHVQEMIQLTYGEDAPQKQAEFKAALEDTTTEDELAYKIEQTRRRVSALHRARYSTLLIHNNSKGEIS